MKEVPILFSTPMVLALLANRKTQTRRIINPQPNPDAYGWVGEQGGGYVPANADGEPIRCRWHIGDRLWVRETFGTCPDEKANWLVVYRADGTAYHMLCENNGQDDAVDHGWKHYALAVPLEEMKWKPSIFMPRWASRITLEVTGLRVERVQSITESDAEAEGCVPLISKKIHGWTPYVLEYSLLWDRINGKTFPWASNPWVWVISFKMLSTPTAEAK